MLKKMFKNRGKVLMIFSLVALLLIIRWFEEVLFYDPFLNYFRLNYYHLPLPKISFVKLFFSLGFRYYLNSMISLGLIYLLFEEAKMVKFSMFLFSVFGIFLMIAFFFILLKFGETNKMNLFYIRRFIIQPIFVIIFIPAFYYQRKMR